MLVAVVDGGCEKDDDNDDEDNDDSDNDDDNSQSKKKLWRGPKGQGRGGGQSWKLCLKEIAKW